MIIKWIKSAIFKKIKPIKINLLIKFDFYLNKLIYQLFKINVNQLVIIFI